MAPLASPTTGEACGRPRGRRPSSGPDDLAVELLLAFARMRGPRRDSALPGRLQALVEGGELAPRHLSAFAVIALFGPLTVSELAEREGFALSTTSLLVTQLSEAGLVERCEDAADRRRTVVSVATAHRHESQVVLEAKLSPIRRALDRLGPAGSRALVQGMRVLVEEFTRAGADDVSPAKKEEAR